MSLVRGSLLVFLLLLSGAGSTASAPPLSAPSFSGASSDVSLGEGGTSPLGMPGKGQGRVQTAEGHPGDRPEGNPSDAELGQGEGEGRGRGDDGNAVDGEALDSSENSVVEVAHSQEEEEEEEEEDEGKDGDDGDDNDNDSGNDNDGAEDDDDADADNEEEAEQSEGGEPGDDDDEPEDVAASLEACSEQRSRGKVLHDQGDFEGAQLAFSRASGALEGSITTQRSLSSSSDATASSLRLLVEQYSTCKIHEALCHLKRGDNARAIACCSDSLGESTASGGSAILDHTLSEMVPPSVRARAFHRRAKAKLSMEDEVGAMDDARTSAFLGDARGVQLLGKLMRDQGGAGSSGSNPGGSSQMADLFQGMFDPPASSSSSSSFSSSSSST